MSGTVERGRGVVEGIPARPDQVGPPSEARGPSRARRRRAAIVTAVVVGLISVFFRQVVTDRADPDPTRADVLIEDDFSDPGSGWVTGRDEHRDVAYEGGRYRVRVLSPTFRDYTYLLFDERPQRLVVEADAEHTAGSPEGFVGVVCPTDRAEEQGYALLTNPDTGQILITEHDGDRWRIMRASRSHALLGKGPLRIGAECFGSVGGGTWLAMTLDGSVVLSAFDEGTTTFIGVGLTVWSSDAGTEASFDDVLASRDAPYPDLPIGEESGAAVDADAMPSIGRVRLQDDFSDPSSGWFTADEAAFRFAYVDGQYEILVGRPREHRYAFRWMDGRFRTIGVKVSVGTASYETPLGAGGPMCLASRDGDDAYAFAVQQRTGAYTILRIAAGGYPERIAWGTSDAILDPIFGNVLHGTCSVAPDGSVDLVLFVNGIKVTEATDREGFDRFVGIGLYADSEDGGTDIRFDDLVVSART